MNHSLLYQAAEMIKKQHRRRNLRTAFTGMASVVVFVTVYMLILPAITLEGKPICGHPEHVHTDACYETVLVCHLSETEGEPPTALPPTRRLICTKEESAGHTHGLNCLDERYLPYGEPICDLTEADGHEHTLLCYDYLIVCCEEERPAVTQQVPDADPGLAPELDPNGDPTEGDLTDLSGELPAPAAPVMKTVVIDPGHTHGPDCVRPIEECWTCELTESTGHSHTDGCYELVEAAAQPLSADGDGEIHYHKHGPECYQKRLICGKMDHQHTDACFKNAELQDDKYICGQVAHTHTAECGPDGDGSYSCGLQEHTHSAACIPPWAAATRTAAPCRPPTRTPSPAAIPATAIRKSTSTTT